MQKLFQRCCLLLSLACVCCLWNAGAKPVDSLPAPEFDSYIAFENQNIGISAQGSPTAGEEDIGCVDPDVLFNRTSSNFYFDLARTMCDRNPECQYFNNREVKHWVVDNTTISYISNYSCGNLTNGTEVPSSACTLHHSASGYLHCKDIDATWAPIATFALPPFLIAKSCNENPLCLAFTVDKKGSTGTIFSASPSEGDDYYLKLPLESEVEKEINSKQKEVHSKFMFGNFHAMEGWALNAVVATVPILAPCNAVAVSDTSLMDVDDLKAACTHAPEKCSTFTTSPVAAPQGGMQSNLMIHQTDVNKTTYISNSVCTPDVGACYDKFPRTYLSCPKLNTAGPAMVMETYDLPAKILAEACAIKGCHFFVSNNDDSGGTLYQFANGVVPNVSVTDSYIRYL